MRGKSFQLPNGTPELQLAHCLRIINAQRDELLPIREKLNLSQLHLSNLQRSADHWKEKYRQAEGEIKKLEEEKGKLKNENNVLKEEIEKLTKTNKRYQVSLFDHGNFKNPTDTGKKEKGGQGGHPDTNREAREDYSTYIRKRLFAKNCGKCGHALSRVNAARPKILIDLILSSDIVKAVLESERQWCSHCEKEVNARDHQALPFTEYGINTFMLIIILRFKAHASLKTIATVISIQYGLSLSKSDISNLLKQAKYFLNSQYEKLLDAVRNGAVMYNDETGWLVHGQKAWLWIMANEKATVYVAAESRGKDIFKEMYGASHARSMHDGYRSYVSVTGEEKTCYCWAHFLRFAHEETILEKKGSEAILIKDELVAIYRIKFQHPEYSPQQLGRSLRERLNKVLTVGHANQTIRAIQGRLIIQKEGLINSLLYTSDGTNNLGEREFRTMVLNRNISYGSDTYAGMETTAVIGSIVQTISKNEADVIPKLKSYLQEGIKEKYWQYCHSPQYE